MWILASVILFSGVFVLTHLPPGTVAADLGSSGADKVAHAAAYGLLTWLLLKSSGSRMLSPRTLLLILFLVVFGGLDEYTQPLVGRTASWFDWLADCAGVAFGSLAWCSPASLISHRAGFRHQ